MKSQVFKPGCLPLVVTLAFEIADLVDAGVGAHDQTVVQQADGLAQVDPFVAGRAADVRREVIAADELDGAVGDVFVGIFGGDFVIVIDIQTMLGPGARFVHDMQERQMAIRTIGEVYSIHGVALSWLSLVEAGVVNLFVNRHRLRRELSAETLSTPERFRSGIPPSSAHSAMKWR
jgi:hypothetical protein